MGLGLPEIDRAAAKRLSEAGRRVMQRLAAARAAAAVPPPIPDEAEVREWLAVYCQAWADLQAFRSESVRLPDAAGDREIEFTRARLAVLERQIGLLQESLGAAPAVKPVRRIWA
jgi:hypothetical protein